MEGTQKTETETASTSLDSSELRKEPRRATGRYSFPPSMPLFRRPVSTPAYTRLRLSARELLNYPLSARSDLYSRLCSPLRATVGRSGACHDSDFYSNIGKRKNDIRLYYRENICGTITQTDNESDVKKICYNNYVPLANVGYDL